MPAAEIGVSARAARRRNYARWRALSLSLVYVVFALHVLHWKLSGKTLAPLELNEVMYTLELGIITAGFLFMSALVVGAMVFGRFFCSWACHIMVLQDLCAYLLRKLRIPLKPVRSRLLLWVPPLTAFYMFLWPQVVRMWRTRAFPTFHLATDADGWASFTTQHFWRNLPGPGIIVLTFLTCGFVVVYLLGSRSFCTYVCPYGAVFGLADRLAPGKIRLKGTCRQCGTCTSVCTSHIRVHEEIDRFGMVVNPACLKDLDCVGACPHGAIGYGWGKPSLLTSLRGVGRFGVPYDFSLREELVMAGVFLTVLLSFRGLYGQIPFLLSLAFGAIAAYATVTALRLAREPNVRLANRFLRERGRLTPAGQAFTVLMAAATLFVAHSGWIRYHEFTGLRLAEAAMHAPHETLSTDAEASRTIARTEVRGSISRGVARNPAPLELARAARAHLLTADRWGLFDNAYVERSLVGVSLRLSDPESAVVYAKRFLRRYPGDAGIRFSYARALDALGRKQEAEEQLRLVIKTTNGNPHQQQTMVSARMALGAALALRGAYVEAERQFRTVAALKPERAEVWADLGGVLAELGRWEEAVASYRRAVSLDDSLGEAEYNLGTLLGHLGRFSEAVPHYRRARDLLPPDADLCNNLAYALWKVGEGERAERIWLEALRIRPDQADAHFNLGRLYAARGRQREALTHLHRAAELDDRYAAWLRQRGRNGSSPGS